MCDYTSSLIYNKRLTWTLPLSWIEFRNRSGFSLYLF